MDTKNEAGDSPFSSASQIAPRTLALRTLLCVGVRLHHAEEVAFSVLAVSEVADRGNRSLGHDELAAGAADGGDRLVEGIHAEGVGGGGDGAFLDINAL